MKTIAPLLELARILADQGQLQLAAREARKAVVRNFHSAEAQMCFGDLMQKVAATVKRRQPVNVTRNILIEAAGAIEKSLRVEPTANGYCRVGQMLYQPGRFDESVRRSKLPSPFDDHWCV